MGEIQTETLQNHQPVRASQEGQTEHQSLDYPNLCLLYNEESAIKLLYHEAGNTIKVIVAGVCFIDRVSAEA